jgi:hypothetical protein
MDTPIAVYALKSVVHLMTKEDVQEECWDEQVTECYSNQRLIKALLKEMLLYRVKVFENPNTWQGCHLHVHKNDYKCSKNATTT